MLGHICKIVILILVTVNAAQLFAQPGCTDPLANNHNAVATSNDGSCTYNTTAYAPMVKVNPLIATLNETSGLQFMGGLLWTFNDSGGDPVLYCIDTMSNTILQTVVLEGATNVDWEDIAFDGTYVYVGDFGNNINGARTNLRIYKFPLSAIPDRLVHPSATIPASVIEVIRFTYANQPQPPATTTQFNTRFDCEAMIVDAGKIHLFTKNYIDLHTVHYEIEGLEPGTKTAFPVDTFASNYLITGADKMPDEDIIVLLGYVLPNPLAGNFGNHFLTILSDYNETRYFSGNKRTINLPNALTMGQAEGICFRNNRYGYISNERINQGGIVVPAQLRTFDVRDFIAGSILSLELKQFLAKRSGKEDQLSWQFDRRVYQMELQNSMDGVEFSSIYRSPVLEGGTYRYSADGATQFYRLMWRNAAGEIQYSGIIQTSGLAEAAVSGIRLNGYGGMTFRVDGSEETEMGFELISPDGRRYGAIAPAKYAPGFHRVQVMRGLPAQQFIYLKITNNKGISALPLFVQ